MTDSKHRPKALGICLLAALGLLALLAASAQAQTGWLKNKVFITAATAAHAVAHPLADGKKHVALLATFGATNTPVEILCETLTTEGGSIVANEKAEGKVKLKFTTCESFLNKVKSVACKPKEPINVTAKFHAILHLKGDKKTYLLGEPEVAGSPFTTIETSEECAFGEKTSITGELVTECLNEKLEKNTAGTDYCLEDLVHHLIQEAPEKLFELEGKAGSFDGLIFGARTALLDGIADLLLSAPNLGQTWAVHI